MEWAILPQSIIALWPVLISRPAEGRTLNWVCTYKALKVYFSLLIGLKPSAGSIPRPVQTADRTGMPPLIDSIIRRGNSLFGHVAGFGGTPQHIKLFSARATSLFDVFLIAPENVPEVVQEASGRIRFTLTTTSRWLIYEDVLSVEVILGWHNEPSRLRDDDDDDDDWNPVHTIHNVEATLSNATSRTILSTKSNVASTLLPYSATMLPVLATMSNEISSSQQSRNKLNMFNFFDFVEITKFYDKLVRHCCLAVFRNKVERCFDTVAGVNGA